jgi:tRNA threonylcarbamoyladenosine biosynthesis protein TsaB
MLSRSLIFHHSPATVIVGYCEGDRVLDSRCVPHREASKELIPCVDALLKQFNSSITELSYLGCNTGPAPFTTLRTVVVTVNGLGFAANLPLVGINGIICLAAEVCLSTNMRTYAVMNAFGAERYYAIGDPAEGCSVSGIASISELGTMVMEYRLIHSNTPVCIVGNKAEEFSGLIGSDAKVQVMTQTTHASLQKIALEVYRLWKAREVTAELVPYYGK